MIAKFCAKCGAEIQEGASFCERCGNSITETKDRQDGKKPLIIVFCVGIVLLISVGTFMLFGLGFFDGKDKSVTKKTNIESAQKKQKQDVHVTSSPEPYNADKSQPSEGEESKEVEGENSETEMQEDESYVDEGTEEQFGTMSVEEVVQHSRDTYYGINNHIKSYSVHMVEGSYKDYCDKKNDNIKKAIMYPGAAGDEILKKYSVEFYYDDDQKLVFAFAYRKVNNHLKEYRAYYGTDGRLYRFINPSGKVEDYEGGIDIQVDSAKLKYRLYSYGIYYPEYAT